MEPFGEVRDDMRWANWIRWYYDSKRGKKGEKLTLGELTLYPDIADEARTARSTADLQAYLGRLAQSG